MQILKWLIISLILSIFLLFILPFDFGVIFWIIFAGVPLAYIIYIIFIKNSIQQKDASNASYRESISVLDHQKTKENQEMSSYHELNNAIQARLKIDTQIDSKKKELKRIKILHYLFTRFLFASFSLSDVEKIENIKKEIVILNEFKNKQRVTLNFAYNKKYEELKDTFSEFEIRCDQVFPKGHHNPEVIDSNIAPLVIGNGGSILFYMYPNSMLIFGQMGSFIGEVNFSEISFDLKIKQKEVTGKYSPNSPGIKYTWRHSCIDNSPDMRFKDNAQITLLVYCQCSISVGPYIIFYNFPDSDENWESYFKFIKCFENFKEEPK